MAKKADQQSSEKKFIKRLKIVVTQKEIDESKVANSNRCMIQESIKRDHPQFERIWVDKNHIRFTDAEKNCIYTFEMPPRGRVMLLKWDAGEPIKPFNVTAHSPIVRERMFDGEAMRPTRNQQHSKQHLGPIPTPKTKEARIRSGKDRVFGRKQWTEELTKLRADLGVTAV